MSNPSRVMGTLGVTLACVFVSTLAFSPSMARADGNDSISRAETLQVPGEVSARLDGAMPLEPEPDDPLCYSGAGRWYQIDVTEEAPFRFGFRVAPAGSILSFYVGSPSAPRFVGCLTHDPENRRTESFRVAGPSSLFVRVSAPNRSTLGISQSPPLPSGTVGFFVDHEADAVPIRPPSNESASTASPIPALPFFTKAETRLSQTEARACNGDGPRLPTTLSLVPYRAVWYEIEVDEPTRVVAEGNSAEGDVPTVTWFESGSTAPIACSHGGTDTEIHYGEVAHAGVDLQPGVRYLLEVASSARYSELWVDVFEAPVWDWGVNDVGLSPYRGTPGLGRFVDGGLTGCHDGICHVRSVYVHITVCSVDDPTRCTVDTEVEAVPYGWDPYAATFPECPGTWQITVELRHVFGTDTNAVNDKDTAIVDVPLEGTGSSCVTTMAVSLLPEL